MPTMTGGASVFGFSRLFAPLEQIHGAGTDPRSDIYSLGATLYHLLTGVVPVDAPSRYNAIEEGRSDPLRPAHLTNADVTEGLSAVLAKAMAISRKERWATAAEMRTALRSARRSIPAAEGSISQTIVVEPSADDERTRSIVFFNNCHNRDHRKIFGSNAFYDLNTTGFQSTLARDLHLGQECIVATLGNNKQIVFNWFSFLREDVKSDDRGIPCRVFFGDFIKSETYSKAEAANTEPYSAFFDINGNFKRHSVHSGTTESVTKEPKGGSRRRTNEKEFFESLLKRPPAEADAARRILHWSRENFTQVNWNGASFAPVLDYGGPFTHNPITVFGVGKVPRVGIKFRRMKVRNGLPKEKLVELLGRINAIPGVHLPADSVDKYPNILLSTLARGDALEQFMRTIEWTNEEVKKLKR